MFAGIVQGTCTVTEVNREGEVYRFAFEFPKETVADVEIGASVSIDGICLTVVKQEDTSLFFDVVQSTLAATTLGGREVGYKANFERSVSFGTEIGGHLVSGHIDGVAKVLEFEAHDQSSRVRFSVEGSGRRYLFQKGFIAVNGVSLTISEASREEGWFEVWLIPETLRVTNLGELSPGSLVNIEYHKGTQVVVDAVFDAVKAFSLKPSGDLSEIDFLSSESLQGLLKLSDGLDVPSKES